MNKNTEPHEIWMLLCYDERTQKHSDFECETKEEAQSLINKGIESCPIHSFVRNVYVDTCARRVRVYKNTSHGEQLIMDFFMYRDIAQEYRNGLDELGERMDEAEIDIVELSNRLSDLEYKLHKENVGSLYGMQVKDKYAVDNTAEVVCMLRTLLEEVKCDEQSQMTLVDVKPSSFEFVIKSAIDALIPF